MSARLDEWEALLDEARSADSRHGAEAVTNLLLAYCLSTIPDEAWDDAVRFARTHGPAKRAEVSA